MEATYVFYSSPLTSYGWTLAGVFDDPDDVQTWLEETGITVSPLFDASEDPLWIETADYLVLGGRADGAPLAVVTETPDAEPELRFLSGPPELKAMIGLRFDMDLANEVMRTMARTGRFSFRTNDFEGLPPDVSVHGTLLPQLDE